jgi:hypothetical protein
MTAAPGGDVDDEIREPEGSTETVDRFLKKLDTDDITETETIDEDDDSPESTDEDDDSDKESQLDLRPGRLTARRTRFAPTCVRWAVRRC